MPKTRPPSPPEFRRQIIELARVLSVSQAGSYAWRCRAPSAYPAAQSVQAATGVTMLHRFTGHDLADDIFLTSLLAQFRKIQAR